MVSFLATFVIAPGVTYGVHPHHRNGAHGKSQWDISEGQERDVFVNARNQNWLLQDMGWGLHLVAGQVSYLGRAQDRQRRIFVAKFVDGNQNQFWHGYPADHQRNPGDIPVQNILQGWLNAKLLRRAIVRKLVRGQPCNL